MVTMLYKSFANDSRATTGEGDILKQWDTHAVFLRHRNVARRGTGKEFVNMRKRDDKAVKAVLGRYVGVTVTACIAAEASSRYIACGRPSLTEGTRAAAAHSKSMRFRRPRYGLKSNVGN